MLKKRHHLSLSLKLLASFAAAIFVLSLFHVFSYSRLLSTMQDNAKSSANEWMSTTSERLDEVFSHSRNAYFALTYTPAYRQASRSAAPGIYAQVALSNQAILNLNGNENIFTYAIFFRDSNDVVTPNGNYTDEEFFSRHYQSETYDAAFWRKEKLQNFSQRSYPAAAYASSNLIYPANTVELMPLALKSYWSSNAMMVLFLDVNAICQSTDAQLTEQFYIFSSETGALLYSTEANPALSACPDTDEPLIEHTDGSYVAKSQSPLTDYTYLKILPKNAVVGQITKNLRFTLFIAFVALALGLVIVIFAVSRLTHPMRAIMQLLPKEEAPAKNELQYIQTTVKQMLTQREQYVRQLSEKDEALSAFLLQSQLKNIYVALDSPDGLPDTGESVFYILYLCTHYRSGALSNIDAPPQTLSYLFLESLQQMLKQLFGTALVFQLEPHQFVAKVSLPPGTQTIDQQMQVLLQRLDHESDFAFFTIVQSMPVPADGDFTAVYRQVLEGAQYAWARPETQLLTLPIEHTGRSRFSYPTGQEQRLKSLIQNGEAEKARALADSVIEENTTRGIRRMHLFLLCSSITGTALRALLELDLPIDEPYAENNQVFNQLLHCETTQDYLVLVGDFVARAAHAAAEHIPKDDAVLRGVRAFLEKNYQREFSMDELAESLHLSKSYLSTYYKGKTGGNLSDSIQFFRIQQAILLLQDKNLRIGEIGKLVGISNSNTFLRQFKKYTGMTPKEYRLEKLSSL